ncbi:O-antigen translocase [Bacteroides sp.]
MAFNNENKQQYKSVFKATALFGGVQIWQILIGIIRSKLVAMILGPAGMGITGLYTSSTELIKSCTSFGLSSSGVKFIAEANATGDKHLLGRTVAIFMRLIRISGVLGMFVIIVFSPLLSKSAFGNYSYTIPFILLSSTLLIQQLASGHLSILQGVRYLKPLAKSSLIGTVLGLVTSVPLYFIFGTGGIVPALILGTLTSLGLNWWYSRKIQIFHVKVSNKEVFSEGKSMLGMGLAMTLSGVLATAVAYIIRIFISNCGGTAEVGLYTAGMTILTTYVGMIFTAMSTDYFPRLSSMNKDNHACTNLVNQQSEIALLILGPVLEFFVIMAPLAIIILYSSEFLPTVSYMQWASIGMLFKAVSWAISFLFLAKSDMKLFVVNETIANLITLLTSVGGYYLFGLEGLGIAFLISYILYFSLVFLICANKYNFTIQGELFKIFLIHLLLVVTVFVSCSFVDNYWKYLPSSIAILVGTIFSFVEIDKRIGIKAFLLRFKK